MKKLYLLSIICLLLFGCVGELPEEVLNEEENLKKEKSVQQEKLKEEDEELKKEESKLVSIEPVVVSVVSEPPASKTAAYGTGIVVDKDNGLILTARHGVYRGDVFNYKNEDLFKNIIVTDKSRAKIMPGWVVHLSRNYDLAVIKVDHRFPSQAVFIPSDFLNIRDEVEFQGFPDGQYGVYNGYIANVKENYLNLDMSIVEGMSGGPLIARNKGIVGIVLLKQKIGGNALRAELILRYLSKALPLARRIRKKAYSLCLKKIRFNETKSEYNKENEPKLYFRFSINGDKLLETEPIEVTGSEMQWNDYTDNKFKLTLLPGDQIEFKVLRSKIYSFIKETVLIEKVFEELPQKGLPDLESEMVIDGNSFFFERID